MVVDFNPQVKKELNRRGIQHIYGDIGHADTLHHAGVHHAKVLISAVPDSLLKGTSNQRLLRQLNQMAPEASVIVTSEIIAAASQMYQEGAGFVMVPRMMGAQELRDAVIAALKGELDDIRRAAAAALKTRSEVPPLSRNRVTPQQGVSPSTNHICRGVVESVKKRKFPGK